MALAYASQDLQDDESIVEARAIEVSVGNRTCTFHLHATTHDVAMFCGVL